MIAKLAPTAPSQATIERAEAVAAQRDAHERVRRYRRAAHLAGQMYAEPFARVFKDELDAWCDWGYRIGVSPVVEPLCVQIEQDAAERGMT